MNATWLVGGVLLLLLATSASGGGAASSDGGKRRPYRRTFWGLLPSDAGDADEWLTDEEFQASESERLGGIFGSMVSRGIEGAAYGQRIGAAIDAPFSGLIGLGVGAVAGAAVGELSEMGRDAGWMT